MSITISPIINQQPASVTIGAGSAGASYSNTMVTGGGLSYSNIPNVTISSGTGYTSPWATTTASPWLGNGLTTDGSGKLSLTGDHADIEINGESLVGLLKQISDRLNLITLNDKMEEEWDQLRELGNQYRALEAKLKEQSNMWAKLKATDNK